MPSTHATRIPNSPTASSFPYSIEAFNSAGFSPSHPDSHLGSPERALGGQPLGTLDPGRVRSCISRLNEKDVWSKLIKLTICFFFFLSLLYSSLFRFMLYEGVNSWLAGYSWLLFVY
ncbi:hypothetical protein BJX99DRAFT_235567 [Aspergillus californicus]